MSEMEISQEQQQFLERFFTAAVNVYGMIDLRTLWNVYMSIKMSGNTEIVPLHRSTMLAYIDEASSSFHPWRVMEINELEPEETPEEMKRVLIESGIGNHTAKDLDLYHSVIAARRGKKVSVPEDFFSYAQFLRNRQQEDLILFLMNLKVSAVEISDVRDPDHKIATENRGSRLQDLTFATVEVKNWFGDHGPGAVEERPGGPAVLLFNTVDWSMRSGYLTPEKSLNYLADALQLMGIVLSKKDARELHRLFSDFARVTPLWREWGASAKDLQETGN